MGFRNWVRKALPPLAPFLPWAGGGGWRDAKWIVREPYTGAWQANDYLSPATAISNPTVYACATLIASDCGKLPLCLVEQDISGAWTETSNPAFSPVLRKPNRYQTLSTFLQQWLMSKLLHGNTYALKQRDGRGVVVALYILDPLRVVPLVAPDGAVYYQVNTDILAQQTTQVTVPASEIIHDLMVPLFHPLVGVSPIFACGTAASQGLTIQQQSAKFFANGSKPGGILLVPTEISKDQAKELKATWQTEFSGANAGAVAILAGGLKYEGTAQSAVDSQLIDQLKWTDEKICSVFHVPAYMVGAAPPPPYGSQGPLIQQYYSQCLQALLVSLEQAMDDGLGLLTPINGTQYGTYVDIDDLIWMDAEARGKAAKEASGTLSPNEARIKFFGMGPVDGGDSPMVQQQYYSLEALAQRDSGDPFAPAPPQLSPNPALPQGQTDLTPADIAATMGGLLLKGWLAA